MTETVNHPRHYNLHPSGVEAVDVCEQMSFNVGNAVKYLFRHEHKGGVEDLRKSLWYIKRELTNLTSRKRFDQSILAPVAATEENVLIRSAFQAIAQSCGVSSTMLTVASRSIEDEITRRTAEKP